LKNQRELKMNKKEAAERINKQIRGVSEVRIVGEGIESKVVKIQEALNIAEEMGLDLVEINSESNPPICKIVDYSKLLYERKQKEKLQKQNNKKIKIKELRFTYNTGEHDFNFKLNHAINFLKEGNKVKAFVFFSGRESNYVDLGNIMLLKFVDALEEYGKPESLPKLDGKRLWVIVSPKK
jgi:translation initiation factor IF-3